MANDQKKADGLGHAAHTGIVSDYKKPKDADKAIVPSAEVRIRSMIHTIRGQQVMLDSDLADLYGVTTGNLNKAASRNSARFPSDFRFRLSKEEYMSLRFQNGISSGDASEHGGRRYMPFVYTEQGVSMLSTVLRSETAVQTSIQIIRAFVQMRHFIAQNSVMFERLRELELDLTTYQQTTNQRLDGMDERVERILSCMEDLEPPKQRVFFDGQIYDAFELLVTLVQRAQSSVMLVDGYTDVDTLNILAKKRTGVHATIWTHPKTKLSARDIAVFNAQYPTLEVHHTTAFHDRFLILDQTECYLVGASLKDAGKKCFGIARLEGIDVVQSLLEKLCGLEQA
ncbi:MAG: ORF6N domain-containing protein [Atopobiaceae bacterium]